MQRGAAQQRGEGWFADVASLSMRFTGVCWVDAVMVLVVSKNYEIV